MNSKNKRMTPLIPSGVKSIMTMNKDTANASSMKTQPPLSKSEDIFPKNDLITKILLNIFLMLFKKTLTNQNNFWIGRVTDSFLEN